MDGVFLREKSIKFVFWALITSLTDAHQFGIALQMGCRREMAVSGSECETAMVRSSAYAIIRAEKGTVSLRRLSMRTIQRKAERTDPCGQPVEMFTVISDELEVRVAFRFDRKLGMSFTRWDGQTFDARASMIAGCQAVSKAALMSKRRLPLLSL